LAVATKLPVELFFETLFDHLL